MRKVFPSNAAFQSNLQTKAAATAEARQLYFALKRLGVAAEFEKFDGEKTIDIAIISAKVNIEVDGTHHNYNPLQAMADLQRTVLSFKKGYLTLRIPNSLIRTHLEDTALSIKEFVMESMTKVAV